MKKSRTEDRKCPACGAPLLYKPKIKKWKCDYCDSEYTIDDLKEDKVEEVVKEEENVTYDHYLCKDCGAEIIADENTSATFCLYCGNTAILKDKLSGKFAPSKIIPFKVVKEDAINAFKTLKNGRPLLPKDFVSEDNIEKITGLYVPFWLYNLNCFGQVNAIGTKVKNWMVGDTYYTKTDTYQIEREIMADYVRIPVDGSEKFDNDIMNSIEPFDYSELTTYNHAYLSGFLAEKYDVGKDTAILDAKKRALSSTMAEAKKSMKGYTTTSVTENNLSSTERSNEYVLLPVWMVNVKYKEKYYIFAMNGQTGEFIGNMPIDKTKAFFIGLAILLGTFALIIGIAFLLFLI